MHGVFAHQRRISAHQPPTGHLQDGGRILAPLPCQGPWQGLVQHGVHAALFWQHGQVTLHPLETFLQLRIGSCIGVTAAAARAVTPSPLAQGGSQRVTGSVAHRERLHELLVPLPCRLPWVVAQFAQGPLTHHLHCGTPHVAPLVCTGHSLIGSSRALARLARDAACTDTERLQQLEGARQARPAQFVRALRRC